MMTYEEVKYYVNQFQLRWRVSMAEAAHTSEYWQWKILNGTDAEHPVFVRLSKDHHEVVLACNGEEYNPFRIKRHPSAWTGTRFNEVYGWIIEDYGGED